ncbi:MAG TPA: Wzz/FepE/Etk N-terminal domain-containing protein [Clostridiaceae bacterium]|jgi:capsular polysaccharide biosynthesis protein|nr:Wzz/FepE/Etk N-terminal domain-containing protein [Clostridiaceae bacterium]
MEELNLKQLINIIWNGKKYIIITIILSVLLGIGYSYFLVTPKYESSTTLVLAKAEEKVSNEISTGITQTDLNLNKNLVSTYRELIRSKTVIRQVMDNLKITDLKENTLRNNVSVSSVKDTELIEITVRDVNPERATNIANEIAKVFTVQVAEIYNINNVHVIDKAEVNNVPYNVHHTKDIVVIALIGAILSIACIIILSLLDTTVKTQEDVEKVTGMIILAEIPEISFDLKVGGKR